MPEKKSTSRPARADISRDDHLLRAAARRIGSRVEAFLAWKLEEDGGLVVIDYDGRKFHFSASELQE
jgi:hypothetical protein